MIYIQSDSERKIPHHFDCACAMYGAMAKQMPYRLTSFEDIQTGKLDTLIKNNLFIGSVEFMREVFNRVGIKDARVPKNSNREHEVITLKEAQDRASGGEKLFIKPLQIKLFTGLVLDGCVYSCLEELPEDTKVMAYPPFEHEILSEWRVYVHNNKVVDATNYSGDPFLSPDESFCNQLAEKVSETFPRAYTMDVAIFGDECFGMNLLVEYNDMWAIGNYGMDNTMYLRLLRDRYFEIMKNHG